MSEAKKVEKAVVKKTAVASKTSSKKKEVIKDKTAKAVKVKAVKIPKITPEELMMTAKKTTLADIKKLHAGDTVKSYNPDQERFQKAVFVGWDEKAQSALLELCHNIWVLDKENIHERPTLITSGKDVYEWNPLKIKKALVKYSQWQKIDLFKKIFGKEIAEVQKPAKA